MVIHRTRISRSTSLVICLVAVITGIVVSFVFPRKNDTPGDQEVYALAAERVARGEQFYRPDQVRAFTYPPFCVLYFTPLNGLDETSRRTIWYLVNFALMAAVVVLVSRRLDPMYRETGPPAWVCISVTTLLAARFVVSPLEYQGHDQVVFLLTLLGIIAWSRERTQSAGFWTGLGAATKATPALFLPVLVWNRHWRGVAVFAIAAGGATLLPDLLFPADDGQLWVVSWYRGFVSKVGVGTAADAKGAWISWNMLNQSLAGTMYRISTPVDVATTDLFDVSLWSLSGSALKATTTALQFAVLGLVAFVTWPGWARNVPDDERAILRMGQGGAVLCAMLLLSPMSSKAHFCTLLLPIAFAVGDFLYRRRDPFVGLALVVVLVAGSLTSKGLLGKELGDVVLAYGSLTWCTLICMLAATRCVVTRSRAVRVEESARAGVLPFPRTDDDCEESRHAA